MTGKAGAEQHRWTDAERARLAEVAPGRSHDEIRAIMTAEFGDHFGGTRIGAALKRYGIKTGRTGRFEPGRVGGFRDESHKRAFLEAGRATRFKPGQMPHNGGRPVGAERVDYDGYTWVKVALRKRDPRSAHDNWRQKHVVAYEAAHGEVPPGCNVVFADHDKGNFDPSNLVAVPRGLWATISHKGLEYHDAESLRACMALASLDKAVHAAECQPRACRKCGAVFRPRYASQRTCDACLGR